jgi:tetratricopeptide (TPR) repeat protein
VELADQSLREIEPDAPFLKDLARAYRKLKRFRNAMDALLLASRIAPLDPEPSRILGEIEEEDLDSKDRAREYYAQSLRLKPTQPDLIEKLEGREARERYEEAAQKALEAMMEPRLPSETAVE